MKHLFLIVLLVCISASHQHTFDEIMQIWQSYVLKHSEKCLKETGADYTLAMRLLPYGEYVDDYKVKCFLSCVVNNLFLTYEDGSVHHQNLLDLISVKDKKIIEESDVVNKCFDIRMDDKCEAFYAVSQCVRNALKELMD